MTADRHGKDTAPASAVAAGERTYEHTPCPKCGGTTRWTSTYNCIPCRRASQRAHTIRQRDWLEAELRRWVAKVGAERVQEAVLGAFVDGGLPLQPATRSGRRKAARKPQDGVA